jgi:hypothetical protein
MLEPEFSVVTPLVVPMSESWSTLPCKFEFAEVIYFENYANTSSTHVLYNSKFAAIQSFDNTQSESQTLSLNKIQIN